MRIVIINSLYRPIFYGGAEKSVSLLAEALVRTGDDVSVITLHPEVEEKVEEIRGVRVYRLPLDNSYWPWGKVEKPNPIRRLIWHTRDIWNRKAAQRVGRILDIEKPDVVHTNCLGGFSVSVWREARRRNIRIVNTLRDYHLLCPRTALFRKGSNCERRCFSCKVLTANRKSASSQIDAVVSISAYVLNEHFRRGFFKNTPSSVIYNIAERGVECGLPTEPDTAGVLVFGFIGSITHEKGLDVILRATTLMANLDWRLKIAGAGLTSYVESLKKRYTDPRIEWLGFANSTEFYNAIDVAIISSVWAEPLSRTVIEAFAAGKSAICALSGGIPEVASLGKVFKTYPATNADALANIMKEAIANPDVWRKGGFKNAEASGLFSSATITRQYRAVYQGEAGSSPLR